MAGFINWDNVPLGTKPDAVIAKELNVNRRTVCTERNKKGIKPFIGKILTQEEFAVRSIYEAMYDAVLHEQGIPHLHEVSVPDTNFKSDFKIDDTFIEIAGMLAYEKYRDKYLKKKQTYEILQIKVVWLDIEEIDKLFSNCKLEIKTRDNTECKLCGIKSLRLVKDLCHQCYCKSWRKVGGHPIAVCGCCQKDFPQYSPDSKFCSRKCYWNTLKLDLPSIDWLEREIAVRSISEVATELGVDYFTLHKRLYRSRKRQTQE